MTNVDSPKVRLFFFYECNGVLFSFVASGLNHLVQNKLTLHKLFLLSLTLTATTTIAADDILKYFYYFSKKISLDISCDQSHMKCQDSFSRKK